MEWSRVTAWIWISFLLPSLFFCLLSFANICDDPSGCVHTNADVVVGWIFQFSPILFILGAILGFKVKKESSGILKALVFSPLFPLVPLVISVFMK